MTWPFCQVIIPPPSQVFLSRGIFLQLVVWVNHIAHLVVVFFCPLSSSQIFFLDFFFSMIISIFLLPNHFPFHCLQFLSNLSQYSWSYLLSDYLNSFFAMNLSGNTSLLNIPFLHSCLAISSMSQRYSFLNSLITSCVFSKFSFPSYVFNSAVNPFQHTKYLSFPLTCHLFRILFTSYSFSPLIITRASCSFFYPYTCSTYCCILLTFTTGYAFTVLGNSNSTAFDDTIFLTL